VYENGIEHIPGFSVSELATAESESADHPTPHRFLGWSPDSRHFAFLASDGKIYIGESVSDMIPVLENLDPFDDPCFRWADNQFYFYCLRGKGLYLASVDTRRQPLEILDSSISVDALDYYYDGK
jgi:hypothetical protein